MTGDNALQLSAGPKARKWAREGVVAIKGKQGRRARGFRVTKEKCSSDNLWTLLKKCDKQKAFTSAPAGKAGRGRAVASAASLRGRLRSWRSHFSAWLAERQMAPAGSKCSSARVLLPAARAAPFRLAKPPRALAAQKSSASCRLAIRGERSSGRDPGLTSRANGRSARMSRNSSKWLTRMMALSGRRLRLTTSKKPARESAPVIAPLQRMPRLTQAKAMDLAASPRDGVAGALTPGYSARGPEASAALTARRKRR